ncbi:hypothetical protein GCM10009682_59930 [Luedemannella flava]|uniref:Uncharacterized protein n=1 Tax=Luedemannella flava TaxID=349316 RepID=A0ABN2MQ50_9ACTN
MRVTFRRVLAAAVAVVLLPVPARATPPVPRVNTAGMAVLAGSTIVRPDGTRIRLTLPRGMEPNAAVEVPAGFLVAVINLRASTSTLWLFPHSGTPHSAPIGDPTLGRWAVTRDGATVIATASTPGHNTFVAYALPSLSERARTRFAGPTDPGPMVLGNVGEQVVLTHVDEDVRRGTTGVWDLRTGHLRRSAQPLRAWGVARDGRLLYRLERGDAGEPPVSACVDTVVIDGSGQIRATPTGVCGQQGGRLIQGSISPDGASALILHWRTPTIESVRSATVTTADLHAGRWRPVRLPGNLMYPLFWDTDRTFITMVVEPFGYARCGVTGRCARLVMPRVPSVDPTTIKPIQRVGVRPAAG